MPPLMSPSDFECCVEPQCWNEGSLDSRQWATSSLPCCTVSIPAGELDSTVILPWIGIWDQLRVRPKDPPVVFNLSQLDHWCVFTLLLHRSSIVFQKTIKTCHWAKRQMPKDMFLRGFGQLKSTAQRNAISDFWYIHITRMNSLLVFLCTWESSTKRQIYQIY